MSDNPTNTPPTNPAPVPANNGESGGQPSEPHWLPDRLAQAKRSAVADFLKELGVDKPDDLKTLLADHKALKESQMNELQKAQAALDKATKKAADAEQKAAELEAARLADRMDGAIRSAAAEARAQYPDDVVTWIRQQGKDLSTLLDQDGKVNDKAVKALIEETKKARPTWFTSGGPGSPSNAGGKPVANPDKILEGKRFTF